MAYRFDLDDVAFLRSPQGKAALELARSLPLTPESRLADITAVRRGVGHRFAAPVLETALLRRRASSVAGNGKVPYAGEWLCTDAALQQASAGEVAGHRAERFADRTVHDVTCSIGADLVAAAGKAERAIGSDIDPVRLAMARHNLAVTGRSATLLCADALRPVSRDAAVFADPARRDSAGRRRWRPDELCPALDDLAGTYRGRDLVVKCAPGLDFDAVPWADEIEIVSLDRQVREAALWTRGLATPGIRRRATVLTSGGTQWTITDAEPDDCPVRDVGEWIVEPDGAVVRAGLVRQFAARTGLGQLDPWIAYLTGDSPPPGMRAFRVVEHGRYREKRLRAALRGLRAGRVEILVRGLDIDPDALRRRLRPSGPAEITVILSRIGDTAMAFLCHAERVPARQPANQAETGSEIPSESQAESSTGRSCPDKHLGDKPSP